MPISIPVGTLTLAEATSQVTFNGNLNAAGNVATQGSTFLSSRMYTDAGLTTPVTAATDITTTNVYVSDGLGGSILMFDSATNPKTITMSGVEKGGKTIAPRTFAFSGASVTGAADFGTTLGDFATFVEDVLGLNNQNVGVTSNLNGNVSFDAQGRMVIVGNEGVVQELGPESIEFSASNIGAGSSQPIALTRSSFANGESVRTSFIIYDSLGTPVTVDMTFVLQGTTASGGTTWQMIAESDDSDALSRVVGLSEVTFDSDGSLLNSTSQTLSIVRSNGANSPMTISLDFSSDTYAVSSLSDTASNLAAVFQNGSPIGTLSNFSIAEDGRIAGSFTNGLTRTIGQVAIAKFTNPEGLVDAGDNLYRSGPNSGAAFITRPREFGTGRLVGSALEQSNVDLSQEFINMILASTGYSAASRVITTTDELINQLLALGR